VLVRPQPGAHADEWVNYFYYRQNRAGIQREWWYHKLGCRRWFLADRDTVTNDVVSAFWPEDAPQPAP
jgi:heterotetrameric sarcosine oxidase delta subunit